ncbi:MAG: hypothetical protein IJN09_01835, partial [Oscillospiraceae bacterium]|nr:hypothetical protein [Oscillospiraceae bacterium]
MKKSIRRGLSLILATALMFCMIPAVGAETAETTTAPTYEYVFTRAATGVTSTTTADYYIQNLASEGIESLDSVSTGKWAPKGRLSGSGYIFLEKGYRYSVKNTSTADDHLLGSNGSLFEISVRESGTFIPSIKYYTHTDGSQVNIYIYKESMGDKTAAKYISAATNGTLAEKPVFSGTFNTYEKDAKEFGTMVPKTFENDLISLEKDMKYYLVVAIDGANTTNDSSNDATPLFFCQLYSFGLDKVETATDAPETVSGEVSFGAYSDVENSVTVTGINGYTYNNQIDSVAVGSTVKAVADTTNPNYKFLGWKRGSAEHGVWLTEEATVEFPIMTHTFLTAVYEPVEDDAAVNVEFYNYKGQYLDTAENVGDKAFSAITKPTATLTGYSNPFWTLDGVNEIADNTIFTKLTRIVAKYSSTDSFAVTIDSETIKGATSN